MILQYLCQDCYWMVIVFKAFKLKKHQKEKAIKQKVQRVLPPMTTHHLNCELPSPD